MCSSGNYYYCNRSGNEREDRKPQDRIRAATPSCKLGRVCTATLITEQSTNTGEIDEVECCLVHYGHATHPKYVRVPKLEWEKLAAKLYQGVPGPRLIEDIDGTVTADLEQLIDEGENVAEHLTRVQCVKPSYLRNLARRCGLKGVRDANDFKSTMKVCFIFG